jgi:hypothetical protein
MKIMGDDVQNLERMINTNDINGGSLAFPDNRHVFIPTAVVRVKVYVRCCIRRHRYP